MKNNVSGIRESLGFDQLIVTFRGVSNVSAAEVYAEKVYKLVDVNVGYDFATMLYRSEEGVKVDMVVLSDIIEQDGGGAEPWFVDS